MSLNDHMLFFRGKDMFPYGLDLQQSESLKAGKMKPAFLLAICASAFPSSICPSFNSTREDRQEHQISPHTSSSAEHHEACAFTQTFI